MKNTSFTKVLSFMGSLIIIMGTLSACFNDGAYRSTTLAALKADNDKDGFNEDQGDCNDADAAVFPGAIEVCGDGIDQDCNRKDLSCNDVDDDGDDFTENQGDCNDADPTIYGSAEEVCSDGIDQNCDGEDLDCSKIDRDGDGLTANVDCDDKDNRRYPGAIEICGDGIDQDCSGQDLGCDDLDRDGDGYSVTLKDCDDTDPDIHPGALEECYLPGQENTARDTNCDGIKPVECTDLDGDGFLTNVDCNDNDGAIYPNAPERHNKIDDNCNKLLDDNAVCSDGSETVYHFDSDGDGRGTRDMYYVACGDTNPEHYVTNCDDLNDSRSDIQPDIFIDANDSIQEAINSIATEGTISLGLGTYRQSGLTIQGKRITLIAEECFHAVREGDKVIIRDTETTIDGLDENGQRLPGERVISYDSSGTENNMSIIINITLAHGSASSGGAVLVNNNSHVFFSKVELMENTADNGGAIALESGSTLTLENSVVENNTALSKGGGIYTTGAAGLHIYGKSRIKNNIANGTDPSSGGGGIVFLNSTNLLIEESVITDNKIIGAAKGGGLLVSGSSEIILLLNEFSLHDNWSDDAVSAAGYGGGIAFINSARVTVGGDTENKNVFSGNDAAQGGGGIYIGDSSESIDLQGNDFISNDSFSTGGWRSVC